MCRIEAIHIEIPCKVSRPKIRSATFLTLPAPKSSVPEVCSGSEPVQDDRRELVNYENVDHRVEFVGRLVHIKICLPQGRLRPRAAAVRDFNISYPIRRLP